MGTVRAIGMFLLLWLILEAVGMHVSYHLVTAICAGLVLVIGDRKPENPN